MLNKISTMVIPTIILIIILCAYIEKISVFEVFTEGVKEGIDIVIGLFPTLLGVFLAIGLLRNSGIIMFIINIISPFINVLGLPKEIMPLALLRPISGSASIAIATDIMKTYGVDSNIGLIASTIMGSTETTFYIIAIYTSCIKIKKTKYVVVAALIADVVGMLVSVEIWRIMSKTFY